MMKIAFLILACVALTFAQTGQELCASSARSATYNKFTICSMLNGRALDAYWVDDSATAEFVRSVEGYINTTISGYSKSFTDANIPVCESCSTAVRTYMCIALFAPQGFTQCYWKNGFDYMRSQAVCRTECGTNCPTGQCCPCSLSNNTACMDIAEAVAEYNDWETYAECLDIPSSFCRAAVSICSGVTGPQVDALCGTKVGKDRGVPLPTGSCPATFTNNVDFTFAYNWTSGPSSYSFTFNYSSSSSGNFSSFGQPLLNLFRRGCDRVVVTPTLPRPRCRSGFLDFFRCDIFSPPPVLPSIGCRGPSIVITSSANVVVPFLTVLLISLARYIF